MYEHDLTLACSVKGLQRSCLQPGDRFHDSTTLQSIQSRWTFLKSTWLPLLQDLHRTVGVLDREESALQAAEEEEAKQAEAQNPGGDQAKGLEAASR